MKMIIIQIVVILAIVALLGFLALDDRRNRRLREAEDETRSIEKD